MAHGGPCREWRLSRGASRATGPDTDEGWVYATISPDLKRVTAAGRIESCMKCHADALHDRLFGLAND